MLRDANSKGSTFAPKFYSMKSILTSALLSLFAFTAVAQEEADSIDALQLHEIVIEAPKVIRKADMDVYYPSRSAVDNSKNGVQLLSNLMIPSLSVSDAMGTIQAAGQSVQVRINGRESTLEQVKTLNPETVKRVEWIDNPGLRYNGANYVLNFIVTNPTAGGSLMANAMPALNQAWGNYFADLKLNSGRSQFEVWGRFKLTNRLKSHRDYEETFTYPDGTSLRRDETSRGGTLDNSMGNFTASYSYIKPDTTVLMVDMSYFRKFSDESTYNGLLSLSNGMDDILLTDMKGGKGSKPYFSVYLEQHFPRKQMLVVDFNGSLYFGRSYSDYIEQLPGSKDYLTDIRTMIKDRNQAYGLEADYIKNWSSSRFTAGVSYTANRNRSVYENLGGEVFHQRQDKVYFFAEYFQRIDRVTLTGGIGAQYTDFLFRETDLGSSSWNIRPQASVTYSINQKHQLRLNFETWQSTPTLAETNPTPQQIDGFQWRIGNTDIKTANSYMLTFRYNFQLPRVYGQFGVRAFTSPNAITPLLRWEGEKLVTSYENSRGLKNLSLFIAPQVEIVPDWLTVSGYLQWRTERMRGTGYNLTNSAWSGHAIIQVRHWGFTLSGQYVRAQRDLWGEKISWGEDINLIDLTYNWKQWGFSAGCLLPFGKYDQGSRSLSKWNTNERHLRTDFRLPYISINYNLQWGKQKRGASKLINGSANADTSTAGSR